MRPKLQMMVVAGMLLIGFCYGQDESAQLVSLRNSYEQKLKEVASPLIDEYLKNLHSLQKEYVKSGDLDGAIAVRDKILKIEKLPRIETNAVVKAVDSDETLREYLLKNEFVFYFNPPRSKAFTFLRDEKIGKGGNISEHSWRIEGHELKIFNSTGDLIFIFSFNAKDNSLRASKTPHKYMSRQGYLEVKK